VKRKNSRFFHVNFCVQTVYTGVILWYNYNRKKKGFFKKHAAKQAENPLRPKKNYKKEKS